MVISLDGYNDFWQSYGPSFDSLELNGVSIPNRTAYQLEISRGSGSGGLESIKQTFPFMTRLFWNSTILGTKVARRLTSDTLTSDEALSANPWPKMAVEIMENYHGSYSHVRFFLSNWRSLRGISREHGIKALFFLQPVLPVVRKVLTENEEEGYEQVFVARPHIDKRDYEAEIGAFYEEVIAEIDEVESLGGDGADGTGEFVDLSQYMAGETRTVFVDNVHYSPLGNQLLAEEISRWVAPHYGLDLSGAVEEGACESFRRGVAPR